MIGMSEIFLIKKKEERDMDDEEFDKFLKEKFRMDAPPIPEEYHKKVDKLLKNLPEDDSNQLKKKLIASIIMIVTLFAAGYWFGRNRF